MGRPKIAIDWAEVDKLCMLHCTRMEVAQWLGLSEDTLERTTRRDKKMRFADYFAEKSAKGKVSLRRKQYQLALSGNIVMLIWLGKQYLGQSDKVAQTAAINVTNNEDEVKALKAEIATLVQSVVKGSE